MSTETIYMPDIDSSGDAIELCVQPGEHIEAGDTMLVLESDKASMEVPAPSAGKVTAWLIEEGQSVDSGMALLTIELNTEHTASAESSSEPVDLPIETQPKTDTAAVANQTAVSPAPQSNASVVENSVAPKVNELSSNVQVYAGPAARRLARELGVDIREVKGSGPKQRILKDDIKAFVKQVISNTAQPESHQANVAAIPPIPLEDFSKYGDIEHKEMSGIAKATALHMSRCWLNIPHATLFDEVDISDMEAFRKSLDPAALGLAKKPTLLAFLIKIVAKALQRFPQFNVSIDMENHSFIQKHYINIGIAVDSPAGLLVPVIRNADQKSLSEIAQAIVELSSKARERKLTPADMQGGCFTLSSLGAIGGTGFTPIVNAPEVAILGIARSAIKPTWDGQQFIPRTQLPLSLSFDHRAINGADAGRFMAYIHECLNDLKKLLL